MSEISDAQASSSKAPLFGAPPPKKLPKGVVLGKDGKPCRSCTSFASWAAMTKAQTSRAPETPPSSSLLTISPTTTTTTTTNASTQTPPSDCPPDVDELGRSTWTLLHSLTANYPETAPAPTQSKTRQFLSLFSEIYPCWVCADDFRDWMALPQNEPQLRGRDEFGFWMCRAHNAVNVKLGKPEFDCRRWKERWADGWRDGRCD